MRYLLLPFVFLAVPACHEDSGSVTSIPTPPAERLLPVSDIMSAIKCELGETFSDNRFQDIVGRDEDAQKDVTATLDLGEVFTLKNSGNGGADFTIPLGIEIGASRSASQSRTRGESFKIAFDYDLTEDTDVPKYCALLEQSVKVQGEPFLDLLNAIQSEHSQLARGNPTVKLRSVDYTTNFAIEKSVTDGAEITLLIFTIGGERSRSVKSSQSLTLSFNLSPTPRAR